MLPPHQFKKKEFTKTLRGYNPVEVDEYLDFIITKYTEVYRENDELERKLKTVLTKLDQLKTDEESIRSALVNAQKASAKITKDANDRAELILNSVKTSCDEILRDFKACVMEEQARLDGLKAAGEKLRSMMVEQYTKNINSVNNEFAKISDFDWTADVNVYLSKALKNGKDRIAGKAQTPTTNTAQALPIENAPEEKGGDTVIFSKVDIPESKDLKEEVTSDNKGKSEYKKHNKKVHTVTDEQLESTTAEFEKVYNDNK